MMTMVLLLMMMVVFVLMMTIVLLLMMTMVLLLMMMVVFVLMMTIVHLLMMTMVLLLMMIVVLELMMMMVVFLADDHGALVVDECQRCWITISTADVGIKYSQRQVEQVRKDSWKSSQLIETVLTRGTVPTLSPLRVNKLVTMIRVAMV